MKATSFFMAAFTVLAVLSGCAKKEAGDPITPPDPAGTQKVFMQLDALRSRATETTSEGQKPDLLSALVYFVDEQGTIYDSRIVGKNAETEMADLLKGVEFTGIPKNAKQVFVVGNYNSSDAASAAAVFPGKGGTLAQVKATVLNIEQVNYPKLTDGTQCTKLLTILVGSGDLIPYRDNEIGWTGEGTPGSEDYYTNVSLKPINARIELEKIEYNGILTSFVWEGLYINKFYRQSPLDVASHQGITTDHGSVTQKYDINDADFGYTDYSTLYQTLHTAASISNQSAVFTAGQDMVWAFQVFGEQPYISHLILKLSEVKNEHNQPVADRFLTVKGLIDESTGDPLTTLEAGKNYKIRNLKFKDDDIAIIPEPELISVWVVVTVEDWVTVNVTPDI